MRRTFPAIFSIFSFLLSACSSAPQAQNQIVSVYATSSAQPWLAGVYACADDLSIIIKMDANEPELYLQLGEPERITTPAYKIGEEEILIVVNNAIAIESLTQIEAREIFTRGNPSVQVWVFSSGADIQRAFDQLVLSESRVTSSARVATSVEQMSATLNSESNAIGFLPKRALTENMRGVYSAGFVPVLALTKQEPQNAVAGLLACLQR